MTQRTSFRYFEASTEAIRLDAIMSVRFALWLRRVEDLPHRAAALIKGRGLFAA